MKIRQKKPALNISKLMGGKNEKARRGALHEKLLLDLYFVYRKYWVEIKVTDYVVCQQEAFYIIELLLHINSGQQTEVIFGFLFTFINHKLLEYFVRVTVS